MNKLDYKLDYVNDFKLVYKKGEDKFTQDIFYEALEDKCDVFIFMKSNHGKKFGAFRSVAFK